MFKEEVSTLSLKLLVGLLLHDNDDITGLLAWELVGLTVESVLLIIGSTLVDLGVKNFLLLDNLLALTSLALVGLIDDLTLTATIVTRSLGLRVHAGSELSHAGNHTATTAGCALLDSAFFASKTIADGANALSVHCNFGCFSIVDLLERALERVHDGLALLGALGTATTTATASEETAKEVVHTTGMTTATLLDAVLTVLVVKFALLTIAEHLVSGLNLLELLFITTTIGMVSSGELEVSLLDDAEISILIDAKDLVELGVVDFLGRATTTHAWHAAHLLKITEGETSASASKEHCPVVCSVVLIICLIS